MADDLAMAEKILDVAGLELTDAARRQLTAYLAGNPRGKEGRVVYDLRADFHLEPDELYERFAFYFDAFPQIRPGGALTVPGIHRERPGADAIRAASGEPARRRRRGHLDVARALQQLPARDRRRSHRRQHRHGLRGAAPPPGLRRRRLVHHR